ncbi:MAG TPA: enolase C-terminal domain-like protein, partial [Limnochordia bacterium]
AKAAIDIAAHDLAAKTLGLPVHRLLGGAVRRRVPLAWAVGLGSTEEMVREAQQYVARGFRTIKLKIGRDPRQDLQNVAAVREAIGPEIALRVDANQGYTVDVAIPTLRRMEAYDLQLIEQPVPRWDLSGMAKIAAALDTPILADEAVFDAHDAWRVIREQAADLINIKIMKPGGLYPSKQVAAVAAAAGVPCLVGSMIEMGPGTAAGLHFAASTPNVLYPSELIGPVMLAGDVICEDRFAPSAVPGYLEVSDEPGLGVSLLDETHPYRRWGEDA